MTETQEITFTSDIVVELVKTDFDDEWPCFAAWTSTKGADATPERKAGLINRLMADHHGTPFEMMDMTFRCTAPLFVWREHHRHRMASYNEESGRYKKLASVFYIPARDRPLVAVEGSKQMDYQVIPGTRQHHDELTYAVHGACTTAYDEYERLLYKGILKEVARMVLPVNIMSTCIVKMNARALMNFISLRTRDAGVSKPMYEIEYVAKQYEQHFAAAAPMTYAAFNACGRVAP